MRIELTQGGSDEAVKIPVTLLLSIYHALRSYAYGNHAPHLAICLATELKHHIARFITIKE